MNFNLKIIYLFCFGINQLYCFHFAGIQNKNEKQVPVKEAKQKKYRFSNDSANIGSEISESLLVYHDKRFLGNNYSKPCTTYKYLVSSNNKHFETREFRTPDELKVHDIIFETFNNYYPGLFDSLDYENLNKIFVGSSSVLIGNIKSSDPITGREFVEYSWITKQKWLDHLKQLHDSFNRSFEVRTGVMMVFNDDLDFNRYWAIVRQNWKTKDSFGKTVCQDNGFLLAAFDFTSERVLKDFKIGFQFGFYEYQYDDIELGIKRYQKIENDITTHFKNEIKSLSGSLKNAMCESMCCVVDIISALPYHTPCLHN